MPEIIETEAPVLGGATDAQIEELLADLSITSNGGGAVEDLVEDVGAQEEIEAVVSAATPDGVVVGDAPVVKPAKVKKVKAAKAPKAAKPAKEVKAKAAPVAAAPKEPKVVVPRKHYTNRADFIADHLGGQLEEFAVLTMDDASREIADVTAATLATIKAMNKKEQNRAALFMQFVAGKKPKLNVVIETALRRLNTDGNLVTGNEGNLFKALSKSYTPASARAMGGNTIGMLTDLKVLVKGEKGVFTANPESLLLAKANALLGITTAA